eukprot:IDg13749t1
MSATAFIPFLAPSTVRTTRTQHARHQLYKRARVAQPHVRARVTRMGVDSETTSAAAIVRTSEPLDSDRLAAFETHVRGEWTGYEADFDPVSGTPRDIPNYYIPEDFVAWGLSPKGFECTYSTIVRGSKYYRKFFRVLPAVALFADHVDLETSFEVVDMNEEPASHCFEDGSFAGGPSPVKIAHASILDKWPCADMCVRAGKHAVHAKLKFDFENAKLVETVRVVREQYSCQYCDGADIEGSSGYVEGWAAQQKSTPAELAGEWTCDDGTSVSRPNGGAPEVPAKCVYLPCGISVGVTRVADGVHAWLSWLTTPDERRVLTRHYNAQGEVVQSALVTETRAS